MNRMILLIVMLFSGIVQALDAPQVVRDSVRKQLVDTDCDNLKLNDWHVYPSQPINDTKLLYHRMVDGYDAIVLDIGAASKNGHRCYMGGSAGTPLVVFIKSQNGQWHIAFDSVLAVQGHTWKKHNGKDRLILGLHGSYCNGYGTQECSSTLELRGSHFTQVNKHSDYKNSPIVQDNIIRSYAPSNPLANPMH